MRIVALDLSLRATGIAASVDGQGRPRLACRTQRADKNDRPTLMDHERVHQQFAAARAASSYAELVLIEKPIAYSDKARGDTSLRLAELHGVVKHWLWSKRIPYVDIDPHHLKCYATGNGNAKKDQVRADVIARYGARLHIGDNDRADAVAMLAMGLDRYGHALAEVPDSHGRAVRSVKWPTLIGEN